MGDAAQSQADKFANEAMKRRLKLQQLREEKRKMLLRQMPGYRQSQHEPVEEEERAPSPVTQRERRKTAAAESELPVGFGGGELKPAKAKGPGFQVDSKDGDTAKRPLPPKKGGSTGDATEFVTAGVSTPAPPPALTRLQSVQMHERVSQRVEEVQEEIEELEAQVEELMRMSRASRASRRASSANFAGQLPGPRRLTRSSTTGGTPAAITREPSMVDERQLGSEHMQIGMPMNVRKTAGVSLGQDGGFAVKAGDVRHVPKQLRKELGLLDISEPTPETTKTAASVRVGADGRFEIGGNVSEQMRLVLEDIERAKGVASRKS